MDYVYFLFLLCFSFSFSCLLDFLFLIPDINGLFYWSFVLLINSSSFLAEWFLFYLHSLLFPPSLQVYCVVLFPSVLSWNATCFQSRIRQSSCRKEVCLRSLMKDTQRSGLLYPPWTGGQELRHPHAGLWAVDTWSHASLSADIWTSEMWRWHCP